MGTGPISEPRFADRELKKRETRSIESNLCQVRFPRSNCGLSFKYFEISENGLISVIGAFPGLELFELKPTLPEILSLATLIIFYFLLRKKKELKNYNAIFGT